MFLVIYFFLEFFSSIQAKEVVSENINQDVKTKITQGYSLSPILGYDPAVGVLVGIAAFRGDVDVKIMNYSNLTVYTNFNNGYGFDFKSKLWNQTRLFSNTRVGLNNFQDSYFGEGSVTELKNKIKIENVRFYLNPSLWCRLTKEWSAGIITELRSRKEMGTLENPNQFFFGNEFTPVFGTAVSYDNRDHEIATKKGRYYQLKFDFGPASFSTRRFAKNFARLELETKHFIFHNEKLVTAYQVMTGISGGDPGFLYRFNLGGNHKLRGYQTNRLRGKHYYMLQSELRYSLNQWFGLVPFIGLGDIGDQTFSDFSTPKFIGGGGIRIGLPPDFIAKARIDLGFSKDEITLFLNFNEAF